MFLPTQGVERGTGEVSGEADQWHRDELASHPGEVVIILVT